MLVRLAALLCAGSCLGGCAEEYLRRSDTLRLESGEAVQANIAVQTVDPAPPQARRYGRDIDGERLRSAIERYRSPQPAGAFGGIAPVPIGATAAPPLGNPLNR